MVAGDRLVEGCKPGEEEEWYPEGLQSFELDR
jgi:hypothetical protein